MNPDVFETIHVHHIYDTIYKRFNETRYSPWKAVDNFISMIESNSIVLDIGCGNGKYSNLLKQSYYIGIDMSSMLIDITKNHGVDALIGNALYLPFRSNSIDYILCIAMLHHLSTKERRFQCIKEIIRVLKSGGQCIITVWALELTDERKNKWIKINESGDYFVQWHHTSILNRYYHFFSKEEIEEIIDVFKDDIIGNYFYDKDNWNILFYKR
uniref:Methyltransferase type 11 domain-containing protein n=1 Tax=viral metagenome TaxID=1070528 RepID=A0A6C0M020_9ZZZZ